jgi:hypothetical protein
MRDEIEDEVMALAGTGEVVALVVVEACAKVSSAGLWVSDASAAIAYSPKPPLSARLSP